MEPSASPRMTRLQKLLERTPNDPFLLYGLALEYKKAGNFPSALQYLQKTTEVDPGYCYAYFQRGQVYEAMGDVPSARQAYLQGIDAAGKKGDQHARSELEGALAMIE